VTAAYCCKLDVLKKVWDWFKDNLINEVKDNNISLSTDREKVPPGVWQERWVNMTDCRKYGVEDQRYSNYSVY
jgi:hypothetical protein